MVLKKMKTQWLPHRKQDLSKKSVSNTSSMVDENRKETFVEFKFQSFCTIFCCCFLWLVGFPKFHPDSLLHISGHVRTGAFH